MKDKSILITGGTDSLGKALTKHILTKYPEIKRLVFFSRDEQKQFEMEQNFPHRYLHEILYKFYLSFKGYWEIKRFAESKNISIFNASEFSMIDAFERKKLS